MPATPPKSRTLPELLAEQAAAASDKPAMFSPLGDRTYGQLADRAARVRAGLRRLQVTRGETVALLAPNMPEWIDAAFGILGVGARLAAFNTWVKAWDLEYLLAHSEARVLIMADHAASNDLLGELRILVPESFEHAAGRWRSERFGHLRHVILLGSGPAPGALGWEDFLGAGTEEDRDAIERVDPSEPAYVLYTSGSTAHPKAVPLVHRGLIENGFNIGERLGVVADDRVWMTSPLFWSFGAANALMATMTHGATLVLQPRFEARLAADLITRHRCTVAYLLPAIAEALLREEGARIRAAGSLRTGAMIGRPDELERVVSELGVGELCNIYGSTETYGNCCVTPHDAPLEKRLRLQGPPLPGVELRVVDPESRAPRPAGQVGEVEVRGHITPGYLGDREATARAFGSDGWYRTGDLGALGEDGWFSFSGRATEMIKSSGINISPVEIERFVITHPDVAEVVVVGTPHPVKGEAAVAFVSVTPGAQLAGEDILAFCKESIAGYKVPAAVIVCEQIPRTDTGKVSRRSLEDQAAAALADPAGKAVR
jgi:fatty-acyl-CoA synthase